MKYLARSFGVFLLWNLVVGTFLLIGDPLAGLATALALSAVLLRFHLLQPWGTETPAMRWATLRLRPLTGPALGWTLIAAPTLLLLGWALGDVYTRFVPVPPDSLDPFAPVMQTAAGRLTMAIFAVTVAPIAEEFVFRGLIQRTLERRFGAVAGITAAAALFAFIHLLPWIFPIHFVLGLVFGFAVWATRSIWAGVILHAANNAAALIGGTASGEEPLATGSVWEIGVSPDLWVSLVALALSMLLSLYVGRRLFEAGHPSRLRPF